jgi:hypothetical protein
VGILPVNLNDRHPEVGSDSVGDPEPTHKRVKRVVSPQPSNLVSRVVRQQVIAGRTFSGKIGTAAPVR